MDLRKENFFTVELCESSHPVGLEYIKFTLWNFIKVLTIPGFYINKFELLTFMKSSNQIGPYICLWNEYSAHVMITEVVGA